MGLPFKGMSLRLEGFFEEQKMDEFIRSIKEVGVDVVIAGGSISDMALHFLNKYKPLREEISSQKRPRG